MEKKFIITALIATAAINTVSVSAAAGSIFPSSQGDGFAVSGSANAPHLIVNITIDQLRSDYLEAFAPLYSTDGFNKLFSGGIVYSGATFPSSRLDRASAAAVLSTGTTPHSNGIVGIQWFDRETLRPVEAIDDSRYAGICTSDKYSPQRLSVTTIGDELKIATSGKALVYSVAPWADEAILQAGHAADGAYWIDNINGYWCSTTFYGKELPGFIRALNINPVSDILKKYTWKPSNAMVGNFNYFLSGRVSRPFEHKFEGIGRIRKFKNTGAVNDVVADAAVSCINNSSIGSDDIPDYLSVTLNGGNFENKLPSEAPIELQDTYVRLDKALGSIITASEKKCGKGNVLIVVTSNGFSLSESEIPARFNIPSGIFNISRTSSLLNMYLSALYGQGKYITAVSGTDIYLDHKLIEEKQLDLDRILDKSVAFLLDITGIKEVYSSTQLQQEANLYGINRIRNSYNPKCSGDIIVELSPGWTLTNDITEERYYTTEANISFPVFFYGLSLEPERLSGVIDVTNIAPTVASVMRIRSPNACSMPPLDVRRR